MAECPACKAEIGRASYCGCGWGSKRTAPGALVTPRVKCCHDTCGMDSFVKIKTKTGWANFCITHYDEYFRRSGEAFCASLGLDTMAKRRQWLRDNWPQFKKRAVEREPGEDMEEMVMADASHTWH